MRQLSITLLALLSFALPSLAPADAEAGDNGKKLKVVATLGDLGAAAREVGGDRVEVKTLAAPQEDPHFVDAKPSYIADLARADLLVLNGMSLEIGWLPSLIDNAGNGELRPGEDGYFDASTVVERQGVPDQEIDRSMGDVHPEGNPHYSHAPRQMARVALALGKRLAELDPDHADGYKKRARTFAKACLKSARKWERKFEELPRERHRVVVFHEAWPYVLDWLDLQQVETVEPKPGVEPNPRHVAKVVQTMKDGDIPVILRMEYYPSSTVESIAEKTGATVVTSKGQTRQGEDYIERVDQLAESIWEALK